MKWFVKLFAPEVESLRRKLSDSLQREDLLQIQINNLIAERDEYKQSWLAEIRAGRVIEDALRNQLLTQANLSNLPTRATLGSETESSDGITDEEKLLLADRATDYCIQKFGIEFPKDKFDQVLAEMTANPDEWLND
jgi:hypothetical protein